MDNTTSAEAVLWELTHLPPTTDPYLWLSNFLKEAFLPKFSSTARMQLIFIMCLLGVCVILIIFSLLIRWRQKQFWLFRWQLGQSLIQPNLGVVGGLAGLVTLALYEVLLYGVILALRMKIPKFYGYFGLLVNLFPAFIGELICWSLAASFIVHLHSTEGNSLRLTRWVKICNFVGIATPLVHLSAFLPLDILVGRAYSHGVDTYNEIDRYLLKKSAEWEPSPVFDFSSLLPLIPLFSNLEEQFHHARGLWTATYAFHAASAAVLIVVLSTITTMYLSSVRRLIQKAKQELIESDSGRGRELLDRVRRTWKFLLILLSVFLLIAGFSLGISLYAALRPLVTSQGYVFVNFWMSSILPILAASILLWQCWATKSAEDQGRRMVERTSENKLISPGLGEKRWSALFDRKSRVDSEKGVDGGISRSGTSIQVAVEVLNRVDVIGESENLEEIKSSQRWSKERGSVL